MQLLGIFASYKTFKLCDVLCYQIYQNGELKDLIGLFLYEILFCLGCCVSAKYLVPAFKPHVTNSVKLSVGNIFTTSCQFYYPRHRLLFTHAFAKIIHCQSGRPEVLT